MQTQSELEERLRREITSLTIERDQARKSQTEMHRKFRDGEIANKRLQGQILLYQHDIDRIREEYAEKQTTQVTQFDVRIVPDNSLPAFAAYLAGEEVDPVPEIRVNFGAIFHVSAEHGFRWEEEVTDCVVHEFLHLVQHKFKLAFDELQVEESIERARELYYADGSYQRPQVFVIRPEDIHERGEIEAAFSTQEKAESFLEEWSKTSVQCMEWQAIPLDEREREKAVVVYEATCYLPSLKVEEEKTFYRLMKPTDPPHQVAHGPSTPFHSDRATAQSSVSQADANALAWERGRSHLYSESIKGTE